MSARRYIAVECPNVCFTIRLSLSAIGMPRSTTATSLACTPSAKCVTKDRSLLRSPGRQIRVRVAHIPYCLHICRPTEDPNEDPTPIPLEEWRAAVAVTEGVRFFSDKTHVATVPTTGSSRSARTRAMQRSFFRAMVNGTQSFIGTRARLHLTHARIRAVHQTRFGQQRSLLLRAWAP